MDRNDRMNAKDSALHNKFSASLQQYLLTTMGMELHKNISIPRVFSRTASTFRDRLAVLDKVGHSYEGITYGELLVKVTNFAAALLRRGIGPHQAVAMFMRNHSAWAISDLGGMFAGCMTVPIYETLSTSIIQIILEESSSRIVVVENKEKLDKIVAIWSQLPELSQIIVVDTTGVVLTDKVISLVQFEESGAQHNKTAPEAVLEAYRQIDRDDVASIVYTSGTTGRPKGVMLTHKNFLANFYGILSLTDVSHTDRFLSILPLCHVLERTVGHFTALLLGATTYYAESIKSISRDIAIVQPTICIGVPRVFEKIHTAVAEKIENSGWLTRRLFAWAIGLGETLHAVRAQQTRSDGNSRTHHRPEEYLQSWAGDIPWRLRLMGQLADFLIYRKIRGRLGGNIRFMVSGGAPLSALVISFFRNLGIIIYEGYGLTETSPIIAFNYHVNYEAGTVGHLMPYSEVRFSPDGELITRGPNVMRGYFRNPEATREVMDEDGWFHTGDVGCFTESNNLKITGRIKEIIVTSGGKNIPIGPIETMINQDKLVSQGLLVGDGRRFISCLIFPDAESIRSLARQLNVPHEDLTQLCDHESVKDAYQKIIDSVNEPISHYERIRKFKLVPYELSIDRGELTPTLKIKRKEILRKFKTEIETIYSE